MRRSKFFEAIVQAVAALAAAAKAIIKFVEQLGRMRQKSPTTDSA